jgi:STE24 endopeptidase
MSLTLSPLLIVFSLIYVLHCAIELALDILNYRYAATQTTIPDFYKDSIDAATFAKTKAYNNEKMRFGMISKLYGIPLFWVLILSGGLRILDALSASIAKPNTLTQSVVYCLLIALIFMIVELPLKAYSTFVIEERHGFNHTTPATFLIDLAKGLLLGTALLTPVLYAIFWFLRESGALWWLWAWIVLTAFQLFTAAVYPTFIAPLFNKFTPLEDGELKERITALAQKIGFKMSGIVVSDGSKRSGHSNAYFAGLGRFRRIVLFDTLIKQLSTDELVAVLAHEMGHNVKKHIRNGMVISSLLSLVGFFILAKLIGWPQFYSSFNAPLTPHAAVILFVLISGTFTFPLTPFMNLWSRHNEFEADAFATETTGMPKAMTGSLLKLTKENLGNLTPHPWYSFYHYTHPTTLERAAAISKLAKAAPTA